MCAANRSAMTAYTKCRRRSDSQTEQTPGSRAAQNYPRRLSCVQHKGGGENDASRRADIRVTFKQGQPQGGHQRNGAKTYDKCPNQVQAKRAPQKEGKRGLKGEKKDEKVGEDKTSRVAPNSAKPASEGSAKMRL